jgi:hypothetical protein
VFTCRETILTSSWREKVQGLFYKMPTISEHYLNMIFVR